MCLRAKLRFCIESHKGLSLSPRRSTAISPQRKRRHRQMGGRDTAFSHARFPTYCDKAGRGEPCTADGATSIGGFSKKGGNFSPILPRFLRKSLPFFSAPNRPRTTPAAVRAGDSRLWPKHGGAWAATAPPLQRIPRGRATPRAKNARRREESREDVGRRA